MSNHKATLNFTNVHHKTIQSSDKLEREIKLGELRLRYVQLMRDFHRALGNEEALELIKESDEIWKKLSS